MKILFSINHPAHFHLFKNSFNKLKTKGHDVVFVMKEKDILEQLLISEKVSYYKIMNKRKHKSAWLTILKGIYEIILQDFRLLKFVRKYRPDIMIGTDYSITHVGKIFGITSIVLNEDDYENNKLFCLLAYPFANCILTPSCCRVGFFEKKQIHYSGFQKLAYLHPEVFVPNPEIVAKQINLSKKYFLIRLVALSAGHDTNITGMNQKTLEEVIRILSRYGNVYISSEKSISNKFEKYNLNIDPKDIHHFLAYSSLLICDGQSMVVEAAMLGTPSIRFNNTKNNLSVLNELETKYNLSTKIHNSKPDLLFKKIEELLNYKDIKNEYIIRKDKMLTEKINVSKLLTWFIENYPSSMDTLANDTNYQCGFLSKTIAANDTI